MEGAVEDLLAMVDSDLDFLKLRWNLRKSPPVYHIDSFSSAFEYFATCIVRLAESSNRTFLRCRQLLVVLLLASRDSLSSLVLLLLLLVSLVVSDKYSNEGRLGNPNLLASR